MNSSVFLPLDGNSIPLTREGKIRLSEVVLQSRNNTPYRKFKIDGLSYQTIINIEKGHSNEVKRTTLQALAPHTLYTYEQLVAICQMGPRTELKDFLIASDLWAIADKQPVDEQVRLVEMIIANLPPNGLKQLARIQRAIALKMEGL